MQIAAPAHIVCLKLSYHDSFVLSLVIMSSLLEKTLRSLDSDYVTTAELAALLPINSNARHAQIKRALAQRHLIRLKRGIYRRGGYLERSAPHPFEIAQYLIWPSYVSLESALSYYGLIPEAIYMTTSVTTQRSKSVANEFGNFGYKQIPHDNFFIDVQRIQTEENVYYVANPWKALCDYVYCYNKNWDNLQPAIESLRLSIEDLPRLSIQLSKVLIDFYSSKRITSFLKGVLSEY